MRQVKLEPALTAVIGRTAPVSGTKPRIGAFPLSRKAICPADAEAHGAVRECSHCWCLHSFLFLRSSNQSTLAVAARMAMVESSLPSGANRKSFCNGGK